jgi:hypothetical protein
MIEREPSQEGRRVLTEVSVHGALERRQDHCYLAGNSEPTCEWQVAQALIEDGHLTDNGGVLSLTEKGRQVERAMFAKYEGHVQDEEPPSTKS